MHKKNPEKCLLKRYVSFFEKHKGFSMMEVTISLVIVGVLLASLSPIISKKIQGTSVISGIGANSNGRTFTPDPNDPDCQPAADGSNAVDCKIQIPSGIDMINASILSGGGGGAASTSSTYMNGLIFQNSASNGTSTMPITSGMTNVKIPSLRGGGGGGGGANTYQYTTNKDTLITASSFSIPNTGVTHNVRAQIMGGGGGGGAAYTTSTTTSNGPSTAFCAKYNALYVPASQSGSGRNTCVTKFNVGDSGGPTIASGVRKITAGTKSTSCSDNNCKVQQEHPAVKATEFMMDAKEQIVPTRHLSILVQPGRLQAQKQVIGA